MFDQVRNRDRGARAAIARMILFGTVRSVAPTKATVRIALGPGADAPVLGPMPWITAAAGPHVKDWRPPEIGEQAVVLCPGGETDQGVAIVGIYSERVPPPSTDPNVTMQSFDDGAEISYDRKNHVLRATLPANTKPKGTAVITAPGGAEIIGDAKITGDLTVTGDINVDGNVDGVDVSAHLHLKEAVPPQPGKTGPPAP